MPVSTAGGGRGDLYCEFNDFTILTEVTMSTSSRQEAMEGEPVRRHVSDAVLKYNKPVYGMFIAIIIPPAREQKSVLFTVILAIVASVAFSSLPVLKHLSGGWAIILITILVSGIAAWLFPRNEEENAG